MILRICTVLVLICFVFPGFSQEKEQFTEVWHTVRLGSKWTKKFESEGRFDARYDATASSMVAYLAELENSLELWPWLSGQLYLRHVWRQDDDNRSRLAVQLTPEYDMGKTELQGRMRWEWNTEDGDVEQRLRVKFRPRYKWSDHAVDGFVEWFLDEGTDIQRTRYGVGWRYKFNKRSGVFGKWMVDVEEEKDVFVYRFGVSHRLL